MNIEKFLEPNANKLIILEGECFANILDAELDIIDCHFSNDNTVYIDTKGYQGIILTIENLKTLQKLILKAQKYYENNLTKIKEESTG